MLGDGADYYDLCELLSALAEARATVRFHKRTGPYPTVVVWVEVDGTEYEGASAAEALLAWARRRKA
jgi:predicted deacylase